MPGSIHTMPRAGEPPRKERVNKRLMRATAQRSVPAITPVKAVPAIPPKQPKVRKPKPPFPWIIFVRSGGKNAPMISKELVAGALIKWAKQRQKDGKIYIHRDVNLCIGKVRFVGDASSVEITQGLMAYGTSEYYGFDDGLPMIQDLAAHFALHLGQATAEIHFGGRSSVVKIVSTPVAPARPEPAKVALQGA